MNKEPHIIDYIVFIPFISIWIIMYKFQKQSSMVDHVFHIYYVLKTIKIVYCKICIIVKEFVTRNLVRVNVFLIFCNNPITNTAWVRPRLCKLQKGCTRLAAASVKVYQLFAQVMVDGSLRVLRHLPPLKLVAMI